MDSLILANTRFGFNLFKELSQMNDRNIFFSPEGIKTAIGMFLLGAHGATAAQLWKVGGFPLLSRHRLSSATLKMCSA